MLSSNFKSLGFQNFLGISSFSTPSFSVLADCVILFSRKFLSFYLSNELKILFIADHKNVKTNMVLAFLKNIKKLRIAEYSLVFGVSPLLCHDFRLVGFWMILVRLQKLFKG